MWSPGRLTGSACFQIKCSSEASITNVAKQCVLYPHLHQDSKNALKSGALVAVRLCLVKSLLGLNADLVRFCVQPKFLTKKQREELAMKRREEEAALQRQKLEEQRKALFGPPAAAAGKEAPSGQQKHNPFSDASGKVLNCSFEPLFMKSCCAGWPRWCCFGTAKVAERSLLRC